MVGRLGVNTKCVCFSCQEAWKVLCRSSARAGQGKSPSQHPLSAVERQSGQSCELPAWCFQASGALIRDLWSCTASSRCRSMSLHSIKSTGVLENGSFLGGNSSVWHGHGEGQDLGGFLLELWAQECFPLGVSHVAAWLSAPSPALRPRGLPAFSRLGRRDQADPSGSTVGRAQSTADGFSPSQWIQGYSCGVLTDGTARCRVGDNSLDPGCGRGAFQSLLCPVSVDNFSLEEKPYSKVLIPVIS